MHETVPQSPLSFQDGIPQLDLRTMVANKNPGLERRIPRFAYRYFERLLHIEQINDFLYRNHSYEGLDFADKIIEEFQANIEVTGIEHIATEGRSILVSNHPLGGLDGIALIQVAGRRRKDILFPVNDLLLSLPNLRSIFIPISKVGIKTMRQHQALSKSFASEKLLLYFPAGLCSRKQAKGVSDLEWKSTFINKARQNKREIIPVHIDARNSNRFYNVALWRKRLGITINLEQLLLVDEMYRQSGSSIHIRIGKPIPYTTFGPEFKDLVWAEKVRDHCYNLRQDINKTFGS